MTMENKKTWFITGTSQGFGLEIVKQVLANGDNVVATSRNISHLLKEVNVSSQHFLPLQVNLLNEEEIKHAIDQSITRFGQIDYVVNNAGYGLLSGIEEASAKEVQNSFEVNVFALLNVTRAILPHMRELKAGHIINISSVFGLIAGAGWGIYCSTKFAVEGLSEALAQEVKPFGIKVTLVEPGYFRTNFLNTGSLITAQTPLTAYMEIAEIKRKHIDEIPGSQPGDPIKLASAIIALTKTPDAPLRLLLGSDALQYAEYKIKLLQEGIAANKHITLSTDF